MQKSEIVMTLQIDPSAELDSEELREITWQLQDHIQQLEAAENDTGFNVAVPQGIQTRGDPLTVGTLIVSLASAGVFTAIIETIRTWALRGESRQVKIKVQVGKKTVELDYSPAAVSQKELTNFTDSIIKALEKD
jgi:hypothetical protein